MEMTAWVSDTTRNMLEPSRHAAIRNREPELLPETRKFLVLCADTASSYLGIRDSYLGFTVSKF